MNGVIVSAEGTKQGAAEATFLFSLGIHPVLQLYAPNIIAFADDIFIIGTLPECESITTSIQTELLHIGLSINAAKSLTINSSTTYLPKILGGLIFPTPSTQHQHVIDLVSQTLASITSSQISLQFKWLLTHHYSWSLSHLARVSTSPHSIPILSQINAIFTTHCIQLFSIPTSYQRSAPLQLFAPLAKGGLGLCDLRTVHSVQSETSKQGHERHYDTETYETQTLDNWKNSWISTDSQRFYPLQLPPSASKSSWVTVLPSRKFYLLSDAQFAHGIHARLDVVTPFHLLCASQFTDSHSFFNHVMTCKSCASAGWSHRHEAIIHAFTAASNIHSVQSTTNVDNLPIPGMDTRCGRKSGPDILIYGPHFFAIDVSCVHQSDVVHNSGTDRLKQRIDQKNSHYSIWQDTSGIPCYPFVVSSYGRITPEAISLINDNYSPKAVPTFSYHIQCALIKATHTSIALLKARSLLSIATDNVARSPSISLNLPSQ